MRRQRRGGARQGILGRTVAVDAAATKAQRKAAIVGKPVNPAQTAEKIMVSGLPTDVSEAQIKELFSTTVGPLRDIQLHYGPQGKWNGSATVLFSQKGHGTKAYDTYNNRLIDGTLLLFTHVLSIAGANFAHRCGNSPFNLPPDLPIVTEKPMRIEIIYDPAKLPLPLASRVAPAPVAAPGRVERVGGRAKRGRGSNKRTGPRPQKSVADLDAEMEDYTAASNPTAAAAGAAPAT
ncbi:hypothetical protein EW145_g348 [Phellinidium pouzarii]|uniref:RRM domain-containing protein n=1 Tax=Phellinidium pouzarii TaxID=167371 RepID=A0A4S4LKJ9_9AGAM|nr:hypothetical protein EW145_g348 [Phellinidium pouzarii]